MTDRDREMYEAIMAGDNVLLEEQARLLRWCRRALDDLFRQKPGTQCLVCGGTTLGNLRAELGREDRPRGVMGENRENTND